MDLLEHQGKAYLARWGVPTPPGATAGSAGEAVARAEAIGYPVVVKAQVRVGGRGKAGGIRLAGGPEEVEAHARAMLGMDIKGHVVARLWLEPACELAEEYYASFTLDRAARLHVVMVSALGGIDVEDVAGQEPRAMVRLHLDPAEGLGLPAAGRLVADAGLAQRAREQAAQVLVDLHRCYVEGDADLVEVNPLALLQDGRILALDAKVVLDDNAAFRHPEWAELRVDEELDARERLARDRGLNYIGLDGTVGIIANGAGLAMSTLDVVTQAGGSAANFLDIGGGASAAVMAAALEVVNADPKVTSILVNIFGGITRGDEVARGIVEAMGRVRLASPVVVRLDGTNSEAGRSVLASYQATISSGRLVMSPTMVDAARTAVALGGGPG